MTELKRVAGKSIHPVSKEVREALVLEIDERLAVMIEEMEKEAWRFSRFDPMYWVPAVNREDYFMYLDSLMSLRKYEAKHCPVLALDEAYLKMRKTVMTRDEQIRWDNGVKFCQTLMEGIEVSYKSYMEEVRINRALGEEEAPKGYQYDGYREVEAMKLAESSTIENY